MITVHGSLKSEGVKLSIVLAVSQNSRAGHKNGVTKSVHRLAFATDFVQKKASGRMPRHVVKSELLVSGTSVSTTARQFEVLRQSVWLWLHRFSTTGTILDLLRFFFFVLLNVLGCRVDILGTN